MYVRSVNSTTYSNLRVYPYSSAWIISWMSRVEKTSCILDNAWITPTMCFDKSRELVVVFKSISYSMSFTPSNIVKKQFEVLTKVTTTLLKSILDWRLRLHGSPASITSSLKNSKYNGRLSTFFAPFSAARASYFLVRF